MIENRTKTMKRRSRTITTNVRNNTLNRSKVLIDEVKKDVAGIEAGTQTLTKKIQADFQKVIIIINSISHPFVHPFGLEGIVDSIEKSVA